MLTERLADTPFGTPEALVKIVQDAELGIVRVLDDLPS